MASKAETGGNAKTGKKKSQKKGAPFSGIAGAFDAANDATMALGPLAGLAREDFIGAIGLMLRQTATNPDKAWKATTNFSEDVVKIMTGKSDLAPDPKDKRFMDPAWTFNLFFKAGAQYYLAVQKGVKSYIEDLDLDALERDRANFVSQIIIDAMSPTNDRAASASRVSSASGVTNRLCTVSVMGASLAARSGVWHGSGWGCNLRRGLRRPVGRAIPLPASLALPYRPVKTGGRFSRKLATPSRWSSVFMRVRMVSMAQPPSSRGSP